MPTDPRLKAAVERMNANTRALASRAPSSDPLRQIGERLSKAAGMEPSAVLTLLDTNLTAVLAALRQGATRQNKAAGFVTLALGGARRYHVPQAERDRLTAIVSRALKAGASDTRAMSVAIANAKP